MKRFFSLPLVLSGMLLSACAIPQQLDSVEKEQRRLRNDNAAIRSDIDSARSSLADTRANVEQIQRELSALKEKVEEVQYQLTRRLGQSSREEDQKAKQMAGRIAKIEGELKGQMTKIEGELKSQAALLKAREEELRALGESLKTAQQNKEGVQGGVASTGESGREKPAGESEAVRRDYEEALKLLDRKDYKSSIARFREFLKKYPNSAYANNAQYWIGEAYYALREFDQAILEFDTVRRKYPKGDKVPAALLKMGFAFAELGDKVDARLILQELADRYPQTEEATKAKQKLKTLES